MMANTPTRGRRTLEPRQRLGERDHAVGVVGAVGHEQRLASGDLQPPRHRRGRKRPPRRRRVEAAEQQPAGRDGEAGVHGLIARRAGHGEVGEALAGQLDQKRAGSPAHQHVATEEVGVRADARADLVGRRLEPVERSAHDRGARADHGRLLGEDQLPGVAQDLGVLQADRGQHHDRRAENVGGVEAAAEAGFDGGRLDAGRAQGDEGGHRERLELRDRPELGRQAQALRCGPARRPPPSAAAATGRPSTSTRSLKPLMCGER